MKVKRYVFKVPLFPLSAEAEANKGPALMDNGERERERERESSFFNSSQRC